MEQVEVVIKGMVITNRYGSLSSGTVLRTDAEFAKHLVEDCKAAEYRTVEAAPEVKAKPEKKQKSKAEEAAQSADENKSAETTNQ